MIGKRIGPYEVVAKVGEGGMGEVYRATDTNLDRDVAIKVLPESFALDADRVARFTREARTLAALNHPNISAIYGLEKAPGLTALVMELVEGEDLSAHIARGPIALPDALRIARQIADALEAAHEQGIIHRDLKPQNIKIKGDIAGGTVKVLDFGLAKAFGPEGAGPTADPMRSPTLTAAAFATGYGGPGTQMGMIVGTAAYMAPEQAKGRPVDKRADIWAFGVVLFEMLTGARAFPGEDITDTMVSVLSKEPQWSLLPTDLSPTMTVFLKRCLQKDPKQRLGDIHDMRLALDGAFDTAAPQTTATAPSPAAQGWWPWALAGTSALVAALIMWIAMRPHPAGDPAVARLLIDVGPAERLLSGYSADMSTGQGRPSRTTMAFSPDGRSLVVSADREGRVQLYHRRLDELDAIPIAGTDGASTPFFSPDGQWLGFYAAGALRKVSVGGGPVVELCKTDQIFGASWSSRDQIVFANAAGGLWRVPAAGGAPTAVTKMEVEAREVSHRLPQFLPDGETVLFTVTHAIFPEWDDTIVVAQSLLTGTRKVLIEGGADARLVGTGHLAYLRRGTLMAVPFDLRRLEVTGPAVGVVSDVMQAANIRPLQIDTGAGQFAVSSRGSLVYATGGVFPQDRWSIVRVDRMGRSEALRVPPGMWQAPRISPDGRRLAFGANARDSDVWTYEVQRGAVARVRIEGREDIPVWAPDGSRLAVSAGVSSSGNLLLIDPDGRSPAETLTPTLADGGAPGSWTADRRALAFTATRRDPQTGTRTRSMWVVSRDGKTEPRQLLSDAAMPDISADGRWLAYASGSPAEVYVQPYPALDHRVQVSINGGTEPVWRRDGREMYYLHNVSAGGALKVRVMAVPVSTTPAFSVGTPRLLFEGAFRIDGGSFRNYDVTADGQGFVMVQEVQRPPARVSQMVLVQNWIEELKQRVPATK